jgi:hypothetical protein
MRHDAALAVIPAQAGIHDFLDSRLRGNDNSLNAVDRQFA